MLYRLIRRILYKQTVTMLANDLLEVIDKGEELEKNLRDLSYAYANPDTYKKYIQVKKEYRRKFGVFKRYVMEDWFPKFHPDFGIVGTWWEHS